VAPLPDIVPSVHANVEVTVKSLGPVSVPFEIDRSATVTFVSTVTVLPFAIAAASVAPGTPAPPHVAALLQLPLCVDVNTVRTVKLPVLVPVPLGVVTETVPVVAPTGTVAVICVSELTTNDAVVPLNETAVAPVKLEPLIATEVPERAEVGVKPVTDGGGGV
jgi:hypothetical protein